MLNLSSLLTAALLLPWLFNAQQQQQAWVFQDFSGKGAAGASWRRWAYWAAAVAFFGLGSFLGAFADKTGGNDWHGTLLAVGAGKAARTAKSA